jgi:GT2 family glycosyltransferase
LLKLDVGQRGNTAPDHPIDKRTADGEKWQAALKAGRPAGRGKPGEIFRRVKQRAATLGKLLPDTRKEPLDDVQSPQEQTMDVMGLGKSGPVLRPGPSRRSGGTGEASRGDRPPPLGPGAPVTPQVSVAVVNWNGAHDLPGCLASVLGQTVPVDAAVYDNASTDGSADLVAGRFPGVRLVRLRENLGYAGAANLAIGASTAEFVLLLNPDVCLGPTFVEHLLAAAAADPRIGSLTGKLLVAPAEEPPRIDSTGHVFFRTRWAVNRGQGEPDRGQHDTPGEVFGVPGAAALYRRAMLEDVRVGGEYLAETFFVYLEDVDLDWRARLRGWRAWYVPAAAGYHRRGHRGRASMKDPRILRHGLKNHCLLLLRNDTVADLVRDLPGVLLTELARAAAYGRARPSAWLGYWDALRLLPRSLRERRLIQTRRTVPRRAFRAWLAAGAFRHRLAGRAGAGPRGRPRPGAANA